MRMLFISTAQTLSNFNITVKRKLAPTCLVISFHCFQCFYTIRLDSILFSLKSTGSEMCSHVRLFIWCYIKICKSILQYCYRFLSFLLLSMANVISVIKFTDLYLIQINTKTQSHYKSSACSMFTFIVVVLFCNVVSWVNEIWGHLKVLCLQTVTFQKRCFYGREVKQGIAR